MPGSAIKSEIAKIAADGFAPVHVQPILKADGGLYGVEALLRVPGIAALEVISIADSFGHLTELELAVVTSCVRIAGERPDLGIIHLNLSWKTMIAPGVASHLNSVVFAAGIDPARLSIELSERERIADGRSAVKALRALKKIGVSFAIDDFGVGYNHLSTVSAIPIQCLKIDQSIVHAVTRGEIEEERERAKRLVLGTKLLAKSLNAEFVLEGIEGPSEKALMIDLECAGQGYFLGMPTLPEEIVIPGKLRSVA